METFLKAIFAGFLIGIGAIAYLLISNPIVGSIFFSIGLFVILVKELNLYTGKVGYLTQKKTSFLELGIIILGNFIGIFLIGQLVLCSKLCFLLYPIATNIVLKKLADSVLSVFILSFLCGILMYIAVSLYKTKTGVAKYLGIFLCVPVFIICGFEHSIANMFYFTITGLWNWHSLLYTIIMIIGNGIGSIFVSIIDII